MNKKVSVIAPARLHMGFLDLSGALGRDFGSIGVSLDALDTCLHLSHSDTTKVTGASSERAKSCLLNLCQKLGVSENLELTIERAIPEHVGLGSGTQMALAIGSALNAYYELGHSVREIARLTERGQRSGIGIGGFEQGGLVVDGGKGEKTLTPPVLSRIAVPEDWYFMLVFDKRGQGLHGQSEREAFNNLKPFPREDAEKICYLVLMQALPAILEQDIEKFGEVISHLQLTVGEHFSPAQGGVFTSVEVETVMQWLQANGGVGIGQTSWGPTGFCLVKSLAVAESLEHQIKDQFSHLSNLTLLVSAARNKGANVIVSEQ